MVMGIPPDLPPSRIPGISRVGFSDIQRRSALPAWPLALALSVQQELGRLLGDEPRPCVIQLAA